jgi:hypothetical protein
MLRKFDSASLTHANQRSDHNALELIERDGVGGPVVQRARS